MAILLVEQYYDFAQELADDYLVMERGEVVARGPGKDMEANGVRKLVAITTNGHRCSFSAADPDARRARGPHSLVEDDGGRLHELNRHTPYRSNLDASTLAVTRRWKKVLWAPLVGTARWMVRRAQAGRTKSSPRRSTAQAMRAFFAAMATTARQ
jgi:ABC-type multidrug transport system ATPase subunit